MSTDAQIPNETAIDTLLDSTKDKSSKTVSNTEYPSMLNRFDENVCEYSIYLPNHSVIKQAMVNTQLVQELFQVLSDRIETCHQTCVSLYDKVTKSKIDNFAELKTISNDLILEEDQYTQRQARHHVLHVNELCTSVNDDIYDGMTGNSPSAVFSLCSQTMNKLTLPDTFLLPNSKDPINLQDLCANPVDLDQCIFEISFGMWNPPLNSRRLAGDLLYVRVHTLEQRIIHITACHNGFYVNKSTDELFDSLPAAVSTKKTFNSIYHSLIDLLQANSQLFKRRWILRMEKIFSQNPLMKVPCSIPVFNWFCKHSSHSFTANNLRSSIYCNEMGLLNDITMSSISPIGQLRDWNEEIQLTRQTFFQPLNKDLLSAHRAAFRVHSDFVLSAVKTAKAVVDGQIPPVNPSEHWNSQMFIWNNLFISMAFDVRDHYKDCGGDIAAHYAAKSDLRGIEYFVNYASSNTSNSTSSLCTVGTVLADYMGYRVAVQSIVPGILEKEQEQSIVYGSIDFGKSFIYNQTYNDKLSSVSERLHLKNHIIESKLIKKELSHDDSKDKTIDITIPVNGDSGCTATLNETATIEKDGECSEQVNIIMPIEVKGIIGNDSRQYILDLIRINPPDLNFIGNQTYVHSMCSLRPELLDQYCSSRHDNEPCSFNVNLAHPLVNVIDSANDNDSLQKLCTYLLDTSLPKLLVKLLDEERPLDGQHLVDIMHKCGINVRYLSHIINICEDIPKIKYISAIARAELICRCAKHVFRLYSQDTFKQYQNSKANPSLPYNTFVAQFLNCFVGFSNDSSNITSTNTAGTKKQKKSRNTTSENGICHLLTDKQLWAKISEDARSYYNFELITNASIERVIIEYNLSKIGLIRRLCQMTGIQLCLTEKGTLWNNGDGNSGGFSSNQIINMNPIVHCIQPPLPQEIKILIDSAKEKLNKGDIQASYLNINCAYNAIMSLYGPIHESVALCLRLLANINFICGDASEAFTLQQRATMITERVKGLDSCYVAYDYFTLAHYCFVATVDSDCQLGVSLMLRARHIACLASPLNSSLLNLHPRMIKIDANLAVMLQSAGAYLIALTYSKCLLDRTDNVQSISTLDRALFFNITSRIYSCSGKLADAITNEKKAFTIYKYELGEDNVLTMQSHAFLRNLTKQRVMLERCIVDNKMSDANIPLLIQTPGKSSSIDLLNMINETQQLGSFLSASEEGLNLLRKLFNITIERHQAKDDDSGVRQSTARPEKAHT
ncbi:hypothetical protein GJ496_006630 [Pomphorhynchus laevis]|nr:hypothetical protein GJ496_006630 [Pomphorhynchus laevis]